MTIGIALIILSQRWTRWSHSGFLLSGIAISGSTVKRSDVRNPVPIGCAFGHHDHQRHSPCSFPMLTVARLFDRRSRLCGSLLISLSANLCNTETILRPDRVEYLDHAKRLARPSRCSNGGKKGGNVAARFDGNADILAWIVESENDDDSGIHCSKYVYQPHDNDK